MSITICRSRWLSPFLDFLRFTDYERNFIQIASCLFKSNTANCATRSKSERLKLQGPTRVKIKLLTTYIASESRYYGGQFTFSTDQVDKINLFCIWSSLPINGLYDCFWSQHFPSRNCCKQQETD